MGMYRTYLSTFESKHMKHSALTTFREVDGYDFG